MKTNYYISNRTHSPIQNKNSANWRLHLTMLFSLFFILVGYAQKGKGKGGGGNNDVILFTCIQDIGNGLYMANFGYTNPTNKTIKVAQEDSYIFLSNRIEDSDNGILKCDGITSFAPDTHEEVLSVVFADNGHAKWTVAFGGSSDVKVRATFESEVCEEDSFIVPVIGPGNGKTRGFVGPELLSLGAGTTGNDRSSIIYQINPDEKVLIQIVPYAGETAEVIRILKEEFDLLPMGNDPWDPVTSDFIVNPDTIISKGLGAIDVLFPIQRILPPEPPDPPMPALIDYFDKIKSAQALHTPFTSGVREGTGLSITQGDAAQSSDIVRESFRIGSADVDGTGVNIVVFSNSFDANESGGQQSFEEIDVEAGDLPGTAGEGNPGGYDTPVKVIKEYPYTFGTISDEGRAMQHIAHDIAPGSNLWFRTGVLSPRDFQLGIQNLIGLKNTIEENGDEITIAEIGPENTIAIDDITFPGEPMFGITNIGEAIQDFTKEGNFYFTSAGNFYDNAYQAIFKASEDTNIPNFVRDPDAVAHVFGTPNGSEDIYQRFRVKSGETYMIVLQWDEDFASQDNTLGAISDLDFWVVDDQERLLVGNNYYNDGEDDIDNDAKDPIEYITFRATADGEANFMITSANGAPPESAPLHFRYIIFIANKMEVLEYFDGAPTMSGHTLTPEALAIGAVDFRKYINSEPFTPQPFSSFGGALPGPTDEAAAQVALSSFDGVNTNVVTIGQNEVDGVPVDGDIYKNFFGTSASVVHVAAAFALAKSAIPSWYDIEIYPDNPPPNILQLFKDNATKVGFEDQLGAGVVNAANTFKQLAAQTAIQISLAVNEGQVDSEGEPLVLSAAPIKVTLTGKYFPEAPEDPNDPENPDPLTVYFGEGEDRIELEIDETTRTDTELVVTVPPFIGNPNVVVNTAPLAGTVDNGGDSNPLPIIEDGRLALRITASEVEIEYGQAYENKFDFTVEGLPAPYANGLPDDKSLNDVLLELELIEDDEDLLPEIVFETNAEGPYPRVDNYTIFPCFDNTEDCRTTKVTELYPEVIVTFKSGPFIVTKKDLTIVPEPIVTSYGEAIILDLKYKDASDNEIGGVFGEMIEIAHGEDFFEDNTLALINRFVAVVNGENGEVNSLEELLDGGSWMATKNTFSNRFVAVVNEMDLIELEVEDFANYFENRFVAVVNRFVAVVNGEDLLTGEVSFENRFVAVVNEGGLGVGNDGNDYSNAFALLSAEDDSETGGSVSTFYALNLITGLDVTPDPEKHYSHPGTYFAPIGENFNITYKSSTIEVNAAILTVKTGDLVIDQGTEIDPTLISTIRTNTEIDGYVYDESVDDVFPEGIQYSFKDANGVEYTAGASGVYFIKIKKPQEPEEPLNYTITYTQIGVLYVNPTGDHLRKIRTYLDCVEEDFSDPSGYNYIANYRYINPNVETIYIADESENKLTGTAPYTGELPFIFLPGENTFQIRFDGSDGKTLKWELTSLDSTHKSSTTSSANANSIKCNTGNSGSESTNAPYILYPNPMNGMLYIDQYNSKVVTLDVFDIYGILYLTQTLDGRNGPITHEINMSACLKGMYFIRCTSNDDVQVYSVVKE